MGILNMLMGNNALGDFDIASDMIKDSKFAVISLGRAVTEVTNPQLKQMLESHLLTAVAQHHQLSDLAAAKAWYKPCLTPQSQVSQDLEMAGNAKS